MGRMSDALSRKGRRLRSEQEAPAAKPTPSRRPGAPTEKKPGRPVSTPAAPGAAKAKPEPSRAASTPQPRMQPTMLAEDWGRKEDTDQERLVSLFAPTSPEGKRIDILRSQLLYPFHGEPPRTIMLTSAAPREGKSLLAANLAISFARGLQQYVMVMDCHLMSPDMHRLLGVPRLPGLTDFLEHGATVPEIIHWTKVDKLSVIPAGSPSRRPAEILATDKMAALLQELRARYADRYILLDTPPVQAFDDPQVLARMVEGIVFVVLAGETDREEVLRALGRLPEDKLIGLVLNDPTRAVVDASQVFSSSEPEGSD